MLKLANRWQTLRMVDTAAKPAMIQDFGVSFPNLALTVYLVGSFCENEMR